MEEQLRTERVRMDLAELGRVARVFCERPLRESQSHDDDPVVTLAKDQRQTPKSKQQSTRRDRQGSLSPLNLFLSFFFFFRLLKIFNP